MQLEYYFISGVIVKLKITAGAGSEFQFPSGFQYMFSNAAHNFIVTDCEGLLKALYMYIPGMILMEY